MRKYLFFMALGATAIALTQTACTKTEAKKGVGINPANFDTSVSPVNDFYQYANGGWMKANPIPSDQIRWGSFSILAENNRQNLHKVAEAAAAKKDAAKGSPE